MAMIHQLMSVQQEQAHVEQLSLTARQIIRQASDVMEHQIGDKEVTISRLYQLQLAVDAHDFTDPDYASNILNGLDDLVYAVAAAVDVHEPEPDFSDQYGDELLPQKQAIRDYVQPVHTGTVGRPSYNIPEDLLQDLIDDGYTAQGQDIADLLP